MKMFQNMGLVEEGAREIREKTYYLTEEGIELAEKISKETEKITTTCFHSLMTKTTAVT